MLDQQRLLTEMRTVKNVEKVLKLFIGGKNKPLFLAQDFKSIFGQGKLAAKDIVGSLTSILIVSCSAFS
jgi:hypothetical protein